MKDPADRFFVLTGGPGSGKTTLIEALKAKGYATAPEAGRTVIRDQIATGGSALPWADRLLFAECMLAFDLRNHAEAREWSGPVFFDRGVPDVVGYLELCGLPVPPATGKAARSYRYARRVFALPPWPEIFGQDAERKQSFDEAERTYRAMVAVYSRLGYELMEAPRAQVDERADFVLAGIGR
ncbi:MAG: AAA family ATPase [Rhizobiales bacterium]|nr:AAA family ATPase [Hyphomicrobiales bacterium]